MLKRLGTFPSPYQSEAEFDPRWLPVDDVHFVMAKKMRFNQKELAYIACKTDVPFDKESILWLKEKEGYLFKNEGILSHAKF